MKLVLTVLARDEEDILDAQLAFHLNAGVDFVIATDNRSHDGTTEILERYVREGHAHVIREEGEDFRQSDWVSRMARLAATDFGADWVIHSDADEFWWPRAESLKELLAGIPPRYGVVRGLLRTFVPQPGTSAFFAERLTLRLAPSAPLNDPWSPFRPNAKVAHRADPGIRVRNGNHGVADTKLVQLRGWHPFEVLHFPLRTPDQMVRKYSAVQGAWGAERGIEHINRTIDEARGGHGDDAIRSFGADAATVASGVAEGVLVHDARLRDVLRGLAGAPELPASGEPPPTFSLPRDGSHLLVFPRPTVVDDALFAAEAAVLEEADGVRALRHLDELEGRIAELERSPGPRVASFVRRLVRRRPAGAQ